jgi:hypothetical protein
VFQAVATTEANRGWRPAENTFTHVLEKSPGLRGRLAMRSYRALDDVRHLSAWLRGYRSGQKKRWRLGTGSSVDNDPAQMSAAGCPPNTANCPRLNIPNL